MKKLLLWFYSKGNCLGQWGNNHYEETLGFLFMLVFLLVLLLIGLAVGESIKAVLR